MASDVSLDRLQRFLQGVIVHPGEVAEALGSPEVRGEIEGNALADVLLPSQTLTAEERIAIYHAMYPLRMYDALAGDYPGLEHFLGDDGFRALVHDYTLVHP